MSFILFFFEVFLIIISICFFLQSNKYIFYICLIYMTCVSLCFYFLLIENYNLVQDILSINMFFELDCISLIMILIVLIIFPFCLLYNYFNIYFNFKIYSICLLVLYVLLILSFFVSDFFFFYIFFESILIPMSIIIGFWGSRGRRVHATYLFFYYTFISSLFILFGIFLTFYNFGTLSFILLKYNYLDLLKDQRLVIVLFFLGFIAKIPCFPVHIWLPEAHVEAPTVGSVVLASILLKLGYYGLIKTIYFISDSYAFFFFKPLFITVFVVSFVYSSFMAVCQIDLKKIVAYSSIVHMNFAMLGFIFSVHGFFGNLFLMFSHGLISAALFFAVGMLYDRFQTRNLVYYGGLVQFMPMFSVFYFIFIFSNMSLPGTCNFIGEILVFFSIFNNTFTLLLLTISSVMLISVFCLIILNRVIFFQVSGFLFYNLYDIRFFEFNILFYLAFYIIFFGLKPYLLINLFTNFLV